MRANKDLNNCRILVTPTSYGKFNAQLKTDLESKVKEVVYNTSGIPLTSEQVAEYLPGIDGYIAGLDKIDKIALDASDSLKVIVRYGTGVDNVDLSAASRKEIIVSNTPGANSSSVAELSLGLMLMISRHIIETSEAIKKGSWPRLPGVSLQGKTIGILGLGSIGKELAKRLKNFDCNIIAYDPFPDKIFAEKHQVKLVDLSTLISNSDFLSLHLPILPETRALVNKEFIRKMKKGSFLINTSRGELIDESALIDGLESEHIKGAALDALEKEPPDTDNPLLQFSQVICTPHIGAQTDGATNNMGSMALEECLRVLSGEEPRYQVN